VTKLHVPKSLPYAGPHRMSEAEAIDAIVASQKAAGDPIDPNGARKLVRALIAIGLFKPA
jgi:hypothetical protein